MALGPGLHLDSTLLPLLFLRVVGVPPIDQSVQHYIKMDRILERKVRHGFITDMNQASTAFPKEQKQATADWLKLHKKEIEELSVGTAFIVSNPVIRAAMTTVFWMFPMPGTSKVVKNLEEAMDWLFPRFEAAGLRPPSRDVVRGLSEKAA